MNEDVDDAIPARLEAIEEVVQIKGGVGDGTQGEVKREVGVEAEGGGFVQKLTVPKGKGEAGGVGEDGVVPEIGRVIKDHGVIHGGQVKRAGEGEQEQRDFVGQGPGTGLRCLARLPCCAGEMFLSGHRG